MNDSYYIVQAKSTPELQREVNDLLGDGWRPCGGPVFVPTSHSVTGGGMWHQALVKAVDHIATSFTNSSTNVIPDVVPMKQPAQKKRPRSSGPSF